VNHTEHVGTTKLRRVIVQSRL